MTPKDAIALVLPAIGIVFAADLLRHIAARLSRPRCAACTEPLWAWQSRGWLVTADGSRLWWHGGGCKAVAG